MQELTREDRARIADTTNSIQSAAANLTKIDARKLPNLAEMKACLQNVDRNLREALRTLGPRRLPTEKL